MTATRGCIDEASTAGPGSLGPTFWHAGDRQAAGTDDGQGRNGTAAGMVTGRGTPAGLQAERAKPDVQLAEVTAGNWRDVVALELDDDQRDLVASNLYSLAEAKFTPLACPRAIYAGTELVGFLMYDLPDEDEPGRAAIYRFMIDRRHQRRGYGKAALEAALDEIRAYPGIATVSICYAAKNPARVLYESLGFKEVERDAQGEIVAELSFSNPAA